MNQVFPQRHGGIGESERYSDGLKFAWWEGVRRIVLLMVFESHSARSALWPHSVRHRNERERILSKIGWCFVAKKSSQ